MSPQQYANQGLVTGAMLQSGFFAPAGLMNLYQFRSGGALDAQYQGGMENYAYTAYANYVYGVYLAAAALTLGEALTAADAYGTGRYGDNGPSSTDPNYPSIPLGNVQNITQGYLDYYNGTLCTPQ
jgi:hypothetical protein